VSEFSEVRSKYGLGMDHVIRCIKIEGQCVKNHRYVDYKHIDGPVVVALLGLMVGLSGAIGT